MTVYLDASGREITLAAAREYAEQRLGRELTGGELALDLVGLDVDLREGKERLTDAIEDAKRIALEDKLRGGPGVLRFTAAMREVMLDLIEAGRRHAIAEIGRLSGREFAEVETYDIPLSFYADHVNRRGSVTGVALRRTATSITVALDRTSWRILLRDAESYRGSLEVVAEETARILRANPPTAPFSIPSPLRPLRPGKPRLPPRSRGRDEEPREEPLGPGDVEEPREPEAADREIPQRRRKPTPPEREPEWTDTYLDAESRLAPMLNAIRVRVGDEARGLRANTLPEEGVSGELLAKLDKRIPGSRDAASRLVSSLLIGGIGEVYEENADLFPCFIYSAVMDGATCEVCRHYDGNRYPSWLDATIDLPGGGPNPRCLGDGRCRCRIVPCAPGDIYYKRIPPEEREGATEADIDAEDARIRREEGDPIQLIRDDVESFVREDSIKPDEQLVNLRAEPLHEFRERGERMKEIGRRISEEADRRVDPAVAAERDRRVKTFEKRQRAFERAMKVKLAAVENEARRLRHSSEEEETNEWWQMKARESDRVRKLQIKEDNARIEMRLAEDALARYDATGIEQRRDALLEVLKEIRPMGGNIHVKPGPDLPDMDFIMAQLQGGYLEDEIGGKRGAELTRKAAQFYPSDWLIYSDSDREGLMASFNPNGRGFYRADTQDEDGNPAGFIVIGGGDSLAGDEDGFTVALHELGHRMEHVVPDLRMWTWLYWYMRTQGSDDPDDHVLKNLGEDFPGNYGTHELTYPDKFVHPYMGKFYGDIPGEMTFELLTMGMEWTFAPPPNLSYPKPIDDDYRNFIIGLLATLGRLPRS
ncbi:MAG: hypothetical protein H0U46_03150 [Actinobacteria bacterium]|nr:hypothetical protein [Actinomycetota bacterium]